VKLSEVSYEEVKWTELRWS